MWKISGYATIYDIEVKNKVIFANLSTSKVRRDKSRKYSPWKRARFVGNAYSKMIEQRVDEKSFIVVTNGAIEAEYDNESNTLTNIITIYDFDLYKSKK